MFTGIIEQTGKVISNVLKDSASSLRVQASFSEVKAGESIAVNGVCLTALPESGAVLVFDLSPETLAVSTLASLQPGDIVNLERAMMASNRFGGHYVSGHVDCRAYVQELRPVGEFVALQIKGFAPGALLYLVPKGSVCVDGVSLTINALDGDVLTCMLVPHTLANTSLRDLKAGQAVNIEFDYLARVVAHQLQCMAKINCEVAQ